MGLPKIFLTYRVAFLIVNSRKSKFLSVFPQSYRNPISKEANASSNSHFIKEVKK